MYLKLKLVLLFMGIVFVLSCGHAFAEEKIFTPEELAKYDGKNGAKAYTAVDGVVYDVSSVPGWTEGMHSFCQQCFAGRDISDVFRAAPEYHKSQRFLDMFTVVGKLGAPKPDPSPSSSPTPQDTAKPSAVPSVVPSRPAAAKAGAGANPGAKPVESAKPASVQTPASTPSEGGDKPVSNTPEPPSYSPEPAADSTAPVSEDSPEPGQAGESAGNTKTPKGPGAGTTAAVVLAFLAAGAGAYLYIRRKRLK